MKPMKALSTLALTTILTLPPPAMAKGHSGTSSVPHTSHAKSTTAPPKATKAPNAAHSSNYAQGVKRDLHGKIALSDTTFRFAAMLLSAVLMTGCAQVVVDSKGMEQQFLLDVFSVKSGKAPTVLIAHGCDGVQRNQSYREWARQISGWGYNAIVVDSYSKRWISNTCNNTSAEILKQGADDLMKTAAWVQQQEWHTGKIGMIGFSRGGSVALTVANQDLLLKGNVLKAGESSKVAAIVAYYPWCFQGSHTDKPNAPTLLLLGAKDDWTPISRCNLEAKTDPNYHITIYPKAGHAFDMNYPTRTVYGHYLFYDHEADIASRMATREFFDKFLH